MYNGIVQSLQSTKNRRSLNKILLSTYSEMAFINTILLILEQDNVIKTDKTKFYKTEFKKNFPNYIIIIICSIKRFMFVVRLEVANA
jgi:hypothetical protein